MSRAPGRTHAPIRLEDAVRELLYVHRLEQSRLLRAASHLRTRRNPASLRSLLPVPRSRRERSGCRTPSSWRALALEEIRTARADGAAVESMLAALVRTPVAAWAPASSIALAALEIEPGHAGSLTLARAFVAERRLEDAVEILVGVLREQPFEEPRLEALEALAMALELAGEVEGCLAFREAALASRGGDLGQAVSLLALALCAGDEGRAAFASSRLHRLDLAVPGVRSRFDAALGIVRHRLASHESRRAGHGSAHRSRIRAFLARNHGPEAEVARLVLQEG